MRAAMIGAGVLGASTAYHLARAGTQVTVIEAARDGRTTAAGAGIICPWVFGVEDAAFYKLYAAGGDYYGALVPALAELGEIELGFHCSGALVVSPDPTDLAFIERFVRQRQAEAPEMGAISRLTPPEARALFPPLREDFGAVHVAGGARVDGSRLAAALLRVSRPPIDWDTSQADGLRQRGDTWTRAGMLERGRAPRSDPKGLAQRRPAAAAGCRVSARRRRCCDCCGARTWNWYRGRSV